MVKLLVIGGESKVNNGAKPCITCDALTTFVVLGPKGLTLDALNCALFTCFMIIILSFYLHVT